LSGKTITSIQALREYGCFRCASRVSDLKKKGYRVHSRIVAGENGKHWAEYFMEVEKQMEMKI